jgi:hypothetical protein
VTIKEECARLSGLIDAQERLMRLVAEGASEPGAADPAYRRGHGALEQSLRALDTPCYCEWAVVHGWHGTALAMGDPAWREWLTRRTEQYRLALKQREKGPPKFAFVDYERYGDGTDVPFDKWRRKLDPEKLTALEAALDEDLAHRGPDVASDWTDARWVRERDETLLEYKIRIDAKSIETPEGGRYPQQELCLRVWCRVKDDKIVLLNGHDKGADVKGEADAMRIAFARLRELEQREGKDLKNARLGRKA